ncbi:hypothetical protein [Saccharothrix obliqua]|uniref:hypothetical protein n=1 Tax=Saccharothrix obliqua TaxID=2861747 RepID=UPI001C5CDE90|nr:hypothetical protein [Saccharothrix obliqua]MBW4721588.1 hypothetical protein [Saccharothrix obliqua]
MVSPASWNQLLRGMLDSLVGENVDLEPARIAFETTRGDFATRFAAAVQVMIAQLAKPEVVIDIPAHPEQLTKNDLEALVRPAAVGFLRSHPTKGELLGELERITRHQERRPSWVPLVDRHGNARPEYRDPSGAQGEGPRRPVVVRSFPELGEVTIHLPTDHDDRPELAMAPGGIGELEVVLHALLGTADEQGPRGEVRIDEMANEALVPDGERWWSTEPAQPVPAAQDPGVASELLATTATLAGLPVDDNTAAGAEAVITALSSAGDWRHSRHWLLDTSTPDDGTGFLGTATAAIAGWADEGKSGLVVYVYGGALHADEGLSAVPDPLHGYLLCATRSTGGGDALAAVHRLVLSCPGPHWCHRGGCPDLDFPEVTALLTPIVLAGQAAAATGGYDWARTAYRRLYGAGEGEGHVDTVLDRVETLLTGAGWVELGRTAWEGGLENTTLRRGLHCLTASYDPVTRQVRLADGRRELELTLDLLADEGVLIGSEGEERVDTGDDAVREWGTDLLTAAEDLLRGRITEPAHGGGPVQATLLGLHPHAEGDLRGPASSSLAEEQLTVLLRTIGAFQCGGGSQVAPGHRHRPLATASNSIQVSTASAARSPHSERDSSTAEGGPKP